MLELLSEPLYILAQLRLRLQLRVFAEASATLARGVATLVLLKASSLDVGISLSMAQVSACLHMHLKRHFSWLNVRVVYNLHCLGGTLKKARVDGESMLYVCAGTAL